MTTDEARSLGAAIGVAVIVIFAVAGTFYRRLGWYARGDGHSYKEWFWHWRGYRYRLIREPLKRTPADQAVRRTGGRRASDSDLLSRQAFIELWT